MPNPHLSAPDGHRAIRIPMLILAALGLAGPASPSDSADPSTDPADLEWGGFLLAEEDTTGLPAQFEMSTLHIRSRRIGIREIVDRCIAHEESLSARIESHEFTLHTRAVFYVGGTDDSADRRLVLESADRHFFRRPDEESIVPLKETTYELSRGERKEWTPDNGGPVGITYEDLNSLPFYLKDRDEYDFEIASREIVGRRVVYEVVLKPRSDFAIAPTGRIWIDSAAYRILREEFDFGDRVPMPIFLKRVGPFVRERERVGDVWVWKRFLVRVDLRMGYLRWLDGDLPDRVEMVLTFTDHHVNEPWSIDRKEDE
jgi:hypothetical protein